MFLYSSPFLYFLKPVFHYFQKLVPGAETCVLLVNK